MNLSCAENIDDLKVVSIPTSILLAVSQPFLREPTKGWHLLRKFELSCLAYVILDEQVEFDFKFLVLACFRNTFVVGYSFKYECLFIWHNGICYRVKSLQTWMKQVYELAGNY